MWSNVRHGRAALLGAVLATVAATAVVWPLLAHTLAHDGHRLIDFEVYRGAGRAVLDGSPVYDFRTSAGLPFTYPPVAAWLAAPLALVPAGAAGVLWTALNLALIAGVLLTVWRPTWTRFGPAAVPIFVAGIAWIFPSRDNVVLGQINLVLLALVLLDCTLPRTRWPRGVLVGLATAIKLTPGLFVPYLWLSGRRRAAYTAAGTFAGLAAVTWLALPEDSSRYWLHEVFDPSRIGNNHFTANQSLRGLALHFGLRGVPVALVVLPLGALALWLALRRAPRLSRAGDEIAALAVVGLASNLLSPVSWVHHMVWFLLAVPVLVHDWRRPLRAAAGVALVALLAYKTIYWGAHLARTTDHAVVEVLGRLVQNSFTLAAFACVAWLPARRSRGDDLDRGDDRDEREQDRAGAAYGVERHDS